MPQGTLEHANLTVSNPDRMSQFLQDLLGWRERWSGPSMMGGKTIHVGDAQSYIALYTDYRARERYRKGFPLNHLGLLVDDLDAAEAVVVAAGLEPFGHDDYDPGRRFYFYDWDGIEFELISYE